MDIAISTDLSDRLLDALEDLACDGDLAYAALIHAGGTILESTGRPPTRCEADEIAALGTGALFAARALGERLGQEQEEGLLREDSLHSFYLHPLGSDLMLLSVGNPTVGAGLVRIASRLHAAPLGTLCREVALCAVPDRSREARLPGEDRSRISIEDLLHPEAAPEGSSGELGPGDIDRALALSASPRGIFPVEETATPRTPDDEGPFHRVFSGMLTRDIGWNPEPPQRKTRAGQPARAATPRTRRHENPRRPPGREDRDQSDASATSTSQVCTT